VCDENGLLIPESIAQFADSVLSATLIATRTNTSCLGCWDVSNLDPKHSILNFPTAACGKPNQVGATCMGLVAGPAWVARTCLCNLCNAITMRHGVKQPPVTSDFAHAKEYLRHFLPQASRIYPEHFNKYDSLDEWIALWPLKKQLAIIDSIANDPIVPWRVKAFVKREVYHKPFTKARAIQMYFNLHTQAWGAPRVTSLQKTFCSIFDGQTRYHGIDVTFASGMNSTALGEWMKETLSRNARCKFYERDGKNWDATMQAAHHELCLMAYSSTRDTEFLNFIDACYKVTGMANDGGSNFLRYIIEGTRKSGHNDTTLGNSLVCALICVQAMRSLGLTGRVIVAGDDLLAAIDQDFDFDALLAAEKSCGIVPEARKFHSWTDVSFISGLWFPIDAENFVFAAKPGRLFARLMWTCNAPPPSFRRAWRHGVVSGLWPTLGQFPIVAEWLRHCDSTTELQYDVSDKFHFEYVEFQQSGDYLLQHFCNRYSITPDQISHIEQELRNLPPEVNFYAHPIIARIMQVDNCDVGDREEY
jgi:hypothetical protein